MRAATVVQVLQDLFYALLHVLFMSPLRRHYIRLLYGKRGVFRPSLRKKGSDLCSAWMKYVECVHLYILWKFGERGSTPRGATGPSLSFLSVCPSRSC